MSEIVNARVAMDGPPRASARRIAIIVNPVAGKYRRSRIGAIAQILRRDGRHVEIAESAGPGCIREIARAIPADMVLAAGGDGTINEAVAGLLDRASPRPAFGVIPQGTANVLGHELGLPRGAQDLANVFLAGHTRKLHPGLANGRPFVLMASAGLDAEVVSSVNLSLKKKLGGLAYIVAAARTLNREAKDIEATIGDTRILAKLFIVSKAKRYGGNYLLDPDADIFNPGFTLVAVSDIRPFALCKIGLALMAGRLDNVSGIRKMRVKAVYLRSRDTVATQIDGDVLGVTPLIVSEGCEALDILTPKA
ncbi:diacylglycerol kinase family protein [Methylocystis sp. ATCC 49242]|uniref:diacylglycerol/lipid kinase family protein n=1 Tax=Methylocystis sp. ATCC 49242 TaxID=622637 RepID=UPI0001F886BB|nr:diacylglycerol kinase family protein [Methylocystis sp. ATCC 49242]